MLHYSNGNGKLSSKILIFDLPAGSTCPGSGECSKVCYAKRAEKRFQHVKDRREENLKALSDIRFFIENTKEKIRSSKKMYVRIHSSGDFLNQEYLDAWKEIARSLENVTFIAFTKSILLNYEDTPKNMRVVYSLRGKHDILVKESDPKADIILDNKDISKYRKEGWIICDIKHMKCLKNCRICFIIPMDKMKIAFTKH